MNNNFFKATIIVLALINTKAFANDADRTFYWSNARGLVKAENCKFEASSKPSLGVVYNSEVSYVTLEKNEGLSNLDIKNMSLVKNLDTELTADKLKVEVVAINSSAGVYKPLLKRLFSKGSVRPQASRGDQGLVDSSNLLNIEKYYIKMNNNNYASDVGGVFWSAYYDDKYVKLNCPEFVDTNNYTIFNIHNEENGKVVSRVGVSSTETELFKDVLIYTNHKIGKYHPDDEISFLPKKVENTENKIIA